MTTLNLEPYPLTASTQNTEFFFNSVGPRGIFTEVIQYTYIPKLRAFNLGFAVMLSGGGIDDKIHTKNGDSDKVLATVGSTIEYFIESYPGSEIVAIGNEPSKHRKYRMMIAKYFSEISIFYTIYGHRNGKLEEFNQILIMIFIK
jgi:hypothetical protein